eukprot:6492331-Amphidinium_carterae.2
MQEHRHSLWLLVWQVRGSVICPTRVADSDSDLRLNAAYKCKADHLRTRQVSGLNGRHCVLKSLQSALRGMCTAVTLGLVSFWAGEGGGVVWQDLDRFVLMGGEPSV